MDRKRNLLYTGPFHPDLEEGFFHLIQDRKGSDPLRPVVVLVGSNLLGIYLRRLLARRGLDHLNVRFFTFLDLAAALAEEALRTENLHPLPSFGDLVLISRLASELGNDSYFRPVAGRRGFQKALAATFRDLGDGGFVQIPAGPGKISDLAGLYAAFRRAIEPHFYTSSDLLIRAAGEVLLFPQRFACSELVVYGFYDFTEVQKNLLETCARNFGITAFLPWRDSAGFAYALETRRWFERMGFEEIKQPGKTEESGLALLQHHLFGEKNPAERAPKDGTVLILSCPGAVQEVREIAREALRLAREEGIPFYEMAVLLRHRDLYAPLIDELFSSLAIPFYLQGGRPLSCTPAGRSLLLLFDLLGGPFVRSAVMEFLTFAPLDWSRFLAEEPSPAQWDLISRLAGIVEGKAQWEDRLARFIPPPGREEKGGRRDLETAAREFRSFIGGFLAALENFPERGSFRRMGQAAAALMENYWLADPDREAVIQALRRLESLDALGSEVSAGEYREILAEALEQTAQPRGSFQKDGICVCDLMPARGLSFRAVFIAGLAERSFPAPARPDPLLLDEERREINRAARGKGKLPLKGARLAEEKILFALAAGGARERLILSFPRLEPDSGRERIPSFFLLRSGEALEGKSLDYSSLRELAVFRQIPLSHLAPEDPDQAIDETEFDLAQIGRALKNPGQGEASYLKALFPGLARAEELARQRWGKPSFTPFDGCLRSARALRILREQHSLSGQILSPTRLETYASCPFRYFLTYVLELEEATSPEEIWRLQPLDRGKILHEILSRFYDRVLDELGWPLPSDGLDAARKILETTARNAFKEAEAAGRTGFQLLWELDREVLLEDLQDFLEREIKAGDEWAPAHFEVPFGGGGKAFPRSAPLSLPIGNGTVSFRGRIDRVDFSAGKDALRVIDYKSGKISGREDGFSGGTALQLPLYLLAAGRLWPGIRMAGSRAEYVSLNRQAKFKRLSFTGENWLEKEKFLQEIMAAIAGGIGSGTFFPYREEERTCRSQCPYDRLCEHSVDELFVRKKGDPRAAEFLKMREIP